MIEVRWFVGKIINNALNQARQDINKETTPIARECVNEQVVDLILDSFSYPFIDIIEVELFILCPTSH